jgi:hypothetical protein
MPSHRFCNLVYAWCVAKVGPEGRDRFDEDLAAPLPGWEKARPSPVQTEEEGAAFMAVMAMAQQRKAAGDGVR